MGTTYAVSAGFKSLYDVTKTSHDVCKQLQIDADEKESIYILAGIAFKAAKDALAAAEEAVKAKYEELINHSDEEMK